MSETPSEDRLNTIEAYLDEPLARFVPIEPAEIREWIKEIRHQRALIEGLKPLARLGNEAVNVLQAGFDFKGVIMQDMAVDVVAVVQTEFDPAKHEDTQSIGVKSGDLWFECPPAVLAAKRALESEE